MRYAESLPQPAKEIPASWDAFNKRELSAAELARKKEYLDVVRWGLRRPSEEQRAKAFKLFLTHPRSELEDAVIHYLARMGPRFRDEKGQNDGLLKYARSLPIGPRVAFLRRVFHAIDHDWRGLGYMAAPLSASSETAERGLAAQVF